MAKRNGGPVKAAQTFTSFILAASVGVVVLIATPLVALWAVREVFGEGVATVVATLSGVLVFIALALAVFSIVMRYMTSRTVADVEEYRLMRQQEMTNRKMLGDGRGKAEGEVVEAHFRPVQHTASFEDWS